jgi:patatin-like phospholipase/acyl hydrolase
MANPGEKSIKVLAIDGGGIRGIIPAVILGELQKRIGKDLWRIFDLIAGTSTGGIIALGIGTQGNKGAPYSPSELLDLYGQKWPGDIPQEFLHTDETADSSKIFPGCVGSNAEDFFPRY